MPEGVGCSFSIPIFYFWFWLFFLVLIWVWMICCLVFYTYSVFFFFHVGYIFFFLISSPTISRKSWKEILLLVEKPSSWARHVSPRALELYVWLGHTTTGTHSVRFCVPFFLILKRMAPSYQRSKHTRISGSHPKWEKKKMDGERPKLGRRRMFMYIYCPVLMDFFFFFAEGIWKEDHGDGAKMLTPEDFHLAAFTIAKIHTHVYIYITWQKHFPSVHIELFVFWRNDIAKQMIMHPFGRLCKSISLCWRIFALCSPCTIFWIVQTLHE